jgi:hypothetical protein
MIPTREGEVMCTLNEEEEEEEEEEFERDLHPAGWEAAKDLQ